MLASMRFKNYIWPHNPKRFEIGFERKISCMKLPFSGHVVQDLGSCARVFSGEGEFFGEDAYAQFRRLAEVFNEGGAGLLSHPLWPSVSAVFQKLSLLEEPGENYVRYSFRFVEYSDGGTAQSLSAAETGTQGGVYTVAEGDCIGKVARKIGISSDRLMRLNPEIKNPNLISAGQVLRTE